MIVLFGDHLRVKQNVTYVIAVEVLMVVGMMQRKNSCGRRDGLYTYVSLPNVNPSRPSHCTVAHPAKWAYAKTQSHCYREGREKFRLN